MENKKTKRMYATNLKDLFKIKKISQKEVAKAIGITETALSQMCSGKYQPSQKNLQKICDLLNVEIITIFKDK